MANYSIKDLALLSGIKPHTIRIWEQRYELLKPHRTDSNFRSYSKDDVQYLIRLAGLNLDGNRISTLATKSRQEIVDGFESLCSSTQNTAVYVQSLLLDMLNLDESVFQKKLNWIQSKIGFDRTCMEVCFEVIEKCNLVLTKRKMHSAYEHFAHAMFRNHLLSQTPDAPADSNAKTFVLFLLEGDFHECPLLFSSYKLKQLGQKVIYLGLSVSPENLVEVCKDVEVDYMLTTMYSQTKQKKIISQLRKIIDGITDNTKLVVSAYFANSLMSEEKKDSCILLSSIEEHRQFLENIAPGRPGMQVA